MERIHLSYKLVSFDSYNHAAFIRAVDRQTGEIIEERIESLIGVTVADVLSESVLAAVHSVRERYPDYVVNPLKVEMEA